MLKFQDIYTVSEQYINIDSVRPFPELPICVLAVGRTKEQIEEVQESIRKQEGFANFQTVFMVHKDVYKDVEGNYQNLYQYSDLSYVSFKEAIEGFCQMNPLIVVVSSPLNT